MINNQYPAAIRVLIDVVGSFSFADCEPISLKGLDPLSRGRALELTDHTRTPMVSVAFRIV